MTTTLTEKFESYVKSTNTLEMNALGKISPEIQDYHEKVQLFRELGLHSQVKMLDDERQSRQKAIELEKERLAKKSKLAFLHEEFPNAYFSKTEELINLLYDNQLKEISLKLKGVFYDRPTFYYDKPEYSSKPETVVEYIGIKNGVKKIGRIGHYKHLNTPIPYGAALLLKEVTTANLFDNIYTIAPNEAWAKTYDVNKGEFEVKQFYPVIDPVIYGVVEENGKNHRFLLAKWGGE